MSRPIIALFVVVEIHASLLEQVLRDARDGQANDAQIWLVDPTSVPKIPKSSEHLSPRPGIDSSWRSCFLSKTPQQCGKWLDLLERYSDRMSTLDGCHCLDKTQFLLYDTRLRKFAKGRHGIMKQAPSLPTILLSPVEELAASVLEHSTEATDYLKPQETVDATDGHLHDTKARLPKKSTPDKQPIHGPHTLYPARRPVNLQSDRLHHTHLLPLRISDNIRLPDHDFTAMTAFEEDEELRTPWPLTPSAGNTNLIKGSFHASTSVAVEKDKDLEEWKEVPLIGA